MKKISHMNILEKTEFINKIASEIKSESKSMSRYESLLKATEIVKEMEKREEIMYQKGEGSI